MRNLEECRAEIFRLGEEKIKERKKRRKLALSVCIPLCLCLVVWSVAILPAMLPASMSDGDDNAQSPSEFTDEVAGDMPMRYTQVDIKGFGDISFYQQIKEPLKANYIADIIENFCDDVPDGSADDPVNGSPDTLLPDNQQSGYLISFTTKKGFKVEYTLSGYVLKNDSTGDSIILTDSQRNQLLSELTGGV